MNRDLLPLMKLPMPPPPAACALAAWFCLSAPLPAQKEEVRRPAAVSSMAESELADFDQQPAPVRRLIQEALKLTTQQLTYVFASHDPARGGMDCSGTIYHLLQKAGITGVPRQSDQICAWVRDRGALHRTEKADTLEHSEFTRLKPGDLVFWSGTYDATRRAIPVTHVMLYLGRNKATGRPVVFGASDGRRYEGQRRTGVSVFDLALPRPGSNASLYGYGAIPGLMDGAGGKKTAQ